MPVPFPKDPYEAIRQAYLVETETHESPTPLLDSTPPTRHVEDSVDSETSVEDDDDEEDDEEEDKEIEESSDCDSKSEGVEDEGPTVEDENPVAGDDGIAVGDEGPGIRVMSLSLGGDEAVPKGHQRVASVVETAVGEPLGLGFGALRYLDIALGEGQMPSVFKVGQGFRFVPETERPERVLALRHPTLTTWIDPEDGISYIDVPVYPPPAPAVQTPPSPEWSSGSLPVSPPPSIVPSPISSPMIPLTIPSPVASPATDETEGFLTELGAQVEMQGGLIRDHMVRLGDLSPALFERYDRDIRELFTSISPEVIAKERRAWLDLAAIVDSMRRGQDPRGDV
ncbi:hypothetical protein Tco_1269991 [Tanacetum coccineum]